MKQTSAQVPGTVMLELRTRGRSPRRIVKELVVGYARRYLRGEQRVLPEGRGHRYDGRANTPECPTTLALSFDDAEWEDVARVLELERERLYPWQLPSIRGIVMAAIEEGL